MESMDIRPTDHTYTQLMAGYARDKNLEMVEKMNTEAIEKYGIKPSKYRYNNLVLCYAKMNRPVDAEKVLREMKDAGLKPDIITYTTLIDGSHRVNNLDKCWDLFRDARELPNAYADQMLLSYMVRLAGKTHESEKALRIFAEMETEGHIEQAKFYNSIISSLGSTKRYAEMAIQYWQKMQLKQVEPDRHTFVAVFRACSKIGDV